MESLQLRDPSAEEYSYWTIRAQDFYNQGGAGVHNHTFGVAFNPEGELAAMPGWSESLEPRFVPGAAPNGLLEKFWTYTSIDGLTSYRPFQFNVNLNTHEALFEHNASRFYVVNKDQSHGADDSLAIYTPNKIVSMAGGLSLGAISDSLTQRLRITGSVIGGAAVAIAPTSINPGESGLSINLPEPSSPGNYYAVQYNGINANDIATEYRNLGSGNMRVQAWAGSQGNAWFRTLANTDWSFGVDRADEGSWKLCNADTLNENICLTVRGVGSIFLPNLPITDPAAVGQLWNNNGVLNISEG